MRMDVTAGYMPMTHSMLLLVAPLLCYIKVTCEELCIFSVSAVDPKRHSRCEQYLMRICGHVPLFVFSFFIYFFHEGSPPSVRNPVDAHAFPQFA